MGQYGCECAWLPVFTPQTPNFELSASNITVASFAVCKVQGETVHYLLSLIYSQGLKPCAA
jgi:hypothetical protein